MIKSIRRRLPESWRLRLALRDWKNLKHLDTKKWKEDDPRWSDSQLVWNYLFPEGFGKNGKDPGRAIMEEILKKADEHKPLAPHPDIKVRKYPSRPGHKVRVENRNGQQWIILEVGPLIGDD